MRKELLVAFAIASLLMITPLTGVALENTVSNNLPEQPKDVEGLVAQIRTVVNEILQKYGHIPMVRSLCDAILNSLGLIILLAICLVGWIILFLSVPVMWLCEFMGLYDIAENMYWNILTGALILASECPDSLEQSFKSLYTLSQTKDNLTNQFDGCPCLQE